MWIFQRRKKLQQLTEQEQVIQKMRNETLRKVERASKSAKKLNDLLEKDGGVSQLIFLATGGDRRGQK